MRLFWKKHDEQICKKKAGRLRRLCAGVMAFVLLGAVPQPDTAYAATESYYIKVNRQQNCVTVYEKDDKGNYTVPVKAMACSVGLNGATPRGTFRLGGKYRWHLLIGNVYGQYCSRITGGILFHSVYYSSSNPWALDYNAYNKLGTTASHGCVRLCVADAKWIYDHCSSGTTVEIYDSKDPGPLGKPSPIKIDTNSKCRGWDPTDPSIYNPWKKEPPVFSGVKNKTIERCSSKSKLTAGVSATDYLGRNVKVKLSGKYNLDKAGKYKVCYQAVDKNGNTAKKTVTITVRDTKKPTVAWNKKKLELTGDTWTFDTVDELTSYLKTYATAKDSGEKLSAKYITVCARRLWSAWERKAYGSYEVSVYAKDKAGNKSVRKLMTVKFSAGQSGTDNGDSGAEVITGPGIAVSGDI